ncbi:MAG: phosphoribosylanthranilate isomerase [Deltaproteobacteria bacterium]|nr:phosphoribosylanthranilate isomerase [Deltaproteobacteria bacterium]
MAARTRVKMCGVTNSYDAEEGVLAGVDALGFIFVDASPRHVSPELARGIIADLPPFVDCVGVFVDRDAREVEEIIVSCGLSHVQLHGSEDPEYCEGLARSAAPCKVIKAFRVGGETEADLFTPYDDVVQGFLLDTYSKGIAGGTGMPFDWRIIDRLRLQLPLILAGGLGPENVREAIRLVRPFAIDVNSSVEWTPGMKNAEKVHAFMEQVRLADQDKAMEG